MKKLIQKLVDIEDTIYLLQQQLDEGIYDLKEIGIDYKEAKRELLKSQMNRS